MHYACKGQHGTTMCRLAMKETLTKIREFLKYKVKIDCNDVLSWQNPLEMEVMCSCELLMPEINLMVCHNMCYFSCW